MVAVGDYVQIKNSRTDDDADEIFKGKVIEIRLAQSGKVALIRTFSYVFTYENIQDLTKLNLKDVARFLV
jgi:hypothetical protein